MSAESSPRAIHLSLLKQADTETQMKVREIRNEAGVRKWMYTDHEIGANEHLGWINRLKKTDQQIVFVVLDDQRSALGVVSVDAIDRRHNKADWAFYLSETSRGGLGSALELSVIDFAFDVLGLEKLNCEVIEGNDPVVKMHEKFLFREEGFRRSNVAKDGVRKGVHLLGLTKSDWAAGCDGVRERFSWVSEKFAVSIDWDAGDESTSSPIDRIEEARARNNLNWMSILRLALEVSPQSAEPIVSDIRRIDKQISRLTEELTKESD